MKLPFRVSFDVIMIDHNPGEIRFDVDPASHTIQIDMLEDEDRGPSVVLCFDACRQLGDLLHECANQGDEPEYTVEIGPAIDLSGIESP